MPSNVHHSEVSIDAGGSILEGELLLPRGAGALVVFAHGSGSSRHSPRNRMVANELRKGGVGTLLFDLLTAEEERVDARTGALRFDIGFLSERLITTLDWLENMPRTQALRIGCFGASTGAAAALVCAALRPERVQAVVSRGGRPDLAGRYLSRVQAPTLLIVGGADTVVLELNRQALAELRTEKELAIVPGATHLFSEPGTLDEVAALARRWFSRHLATGEQPRA